MTVSALHHLMQLELRTMWVCSSTSSTTEDAAKVRTTSPVTIFAAAVATSCWSAIKIFSCTRANANVAISGVRCEHACKAMRTCQQRNVAFTAACDVRPALGHMCSTL